MVSPYGFLYQFMQNGTACIGKVQPQNDKVTPIFPGFPQYLGNDSSMFEVRNPVLLYWSVNIIIP